MRIIDEPEKSTGYEKDVTELKNAGAGKLGVILVPTQGRTTQIALLREEARKQDRSLRIIKEVPRGDDTEYTVKLNPRVTRTRKAAETGESE